MDSQEWLSGNAHRRFPFAEASANATGVDLDVLSDWVLDLRVFVSPHEEIDCWISAIAWADGHPLYLEGQAVTLEGEVVTISTLTPDNLTYNGQNLLLNGQPLTITGSADSLAAGTYVIELSNSTGVIATLAFPVQDIFGSPDYQTKRYAFNGRTVAILSPGKNWNDPASIGVTELNSLSFITPQEIESTRIHPTNVNTDIRSFKGFYLAAPYYDADGNLVEEDEITPDIGDYPEVSANKLRAGYNIQLKQDGDFLDFDLVSGAGDGLYPCQDTDCKPKVRTINGLSPTEDGDISLEFVDCLRHSSRTDIDPLTGLANLHGIKIYSDCLPCCTCSDYSHVSLAIGRMSAKFKEVNMDMNGILLTSQDLYNEAIEAAMARLPGMAVVYQVQVFADRAEVSILNNSQLPVYAVVGVGITPLGDIELRPASNITSGVVMTTPPLSGLDPSEQGTGITDPNDVPGWNPGNIQFTLGYGDSFAPIPPAAISKFVLQSPSAKEKLDELTAICSKLQIFLGGSLGQSILDGDAAYQDLLTEFNTLAIVSPDCLGTDLPGDDYSTSDEGYNDRYRCNVQAQADSLRRQELRDWMLARKYELAFDVGICNANVMTPEMASLIQDLRDLKDMLNAECKDGSFSCTDNDSDAGEWNWDCTSALYGDVCQGQIRGQNIERSKLYVAVEKVLRDQITEVRSKIEECLGSGMFADLVDQLSISTLAIYGQDINLGCNAGNRIVEIDRTEPVGQGYDCLSELISIVSLSTEKPIVDPPP